MVSPNNSKSVFKLNVKKYEKLLKMDKPSCAEALSLENIQVGAGAANRR